MTTEPSRLGKQESLLSLLLLGAVLVIAAPVALTIGIMITTDPFPCGQDVDCLPDQRASLSLATDLLLVIAPLVLWLATAVTVIVLMMRKRRTLWVALGGIALIVLSIVAAVLVWQLAKL